MLDYKKIKIPNKKKCKFVKNCILCIVYKYGNDMVISEGNENPRSWKRSKNIKIDTYMLILTKIYNT